MTNEGLLLDAGCGKSFGVLQTLSNTTAFVGADILRANVVNSKRRWKNFNYVVADIGCLPFRDSAFKGVLCIDVLEHLPDKPAKIGELARVTDKGGFFIGSTTNLLNPPLWLDAKMPFLAKPLVAKFAPGHYDRHDRFSPSKLVNVLISSKYRVDYLTLIGHPQFTQVKLPWFWRLWVLFDRLTNKNPLQYLKEIMIWQATRV